MSFIFCLSNANHWWAKKHVFGSRKSSCVDSLLFQLILIKTPAEYLYSTGDNLKRNKITTVEKYYRLDYCYQGY
jgi:hypothetical protein